MIQIGIYSPYTYPNIHQGLVTNAWWPLQQDSEVITA